MLLWLSGSENTKDVAERELRPRADGAVHARRGRGYTEHDVREQARALTGFRNDWDDGVGPNNFRFDAEHHDAGIKRVLGKQGPLRLARRLPAVPRAPEPPVLLRREAVVLLHPGRRRAAGRGARSSACTCAGDYEVRPVVEAILRHPELYGARAW